MKKIKLESLNKSKFDKFESKRIALSLNIFGGQTIKSPKDSNECTDTFNYTKRDMGGGLVYKAHDNVKWDCPEGKDTIPSLI